MIFFLSLPLGEAGVFGDVCVLGLVGLLLDASCCCCWVGDDGRESSAGGEGVGGNGDTVSILIVLSICGWIQLVTNSPF